MDIINIRTPYFVEVNEFGQTGAKVELFFAYVPSYGSTPTYTLTELVPSAVQTNLSFNISNYAKEIIKPINPVYTTSATAENSQTKIFVQIKRYSLISGVYTLVDTTEKLCLNGFNTYADGYNNVITSDTYAMYHDVTLKVKDFSSAYVNVYLEAGSYGVLYNNLPDETLIVTTDNVFKIPIKSNLITIEGGTDDVVINAEQECEPKYTPLVCTYVNRFGGWQYLTFFKANSEQITTDSKEFSLLPANLDYNVLQGQRKGFNFQGKQTIKANTGWVSERYFDLIQDLMLSETVLLDNKPVMIKSKSMGKKTHLKDKNINYEIEFEYNFGLINDVI